MTDDYRYMLEIFEEGGEVRLGDPVLLESPWLRGVEALRWKEFQAGRQFDLAGVQQSVRWVNGGPPHASHLAVRSSRGGAEVQVDLRAFSAQAARATARRVVRSGLLPEGGIYDYRVVAYPVSEARASEFSLAEYPQLHDVDPVGDLTEHDSEFAEPGDFGVRIANGVVDQAIAFAAAAGKNESGGVLLGRLVRAGRSTAPSLEVSHLVPAIGVGEERSFTFTVETWNHARAVLADREQRTNRGEYIVSWVHSHPDFCKPSCPPELRKKCALRKPFFSAEDQHLHATLFPAAYSVGLLITDSGSGHIASVWGWRSGQVVRRGWHTVELEHES